MQRFQLLFQMDKTFGGPSWKVNLLFLTCSIFALHTDAVARTTVEVYWNKTTTMFQSNNNDHMIDVNLGDRLNIICPHYSDRTIPMSHWEYYLIYMVDFYNYELCVINDTSNKIAILNCSNPEVSKFFTLLIFEFQPIPGIPDFQMSKRYYFISTSGGRLFNINNQYEGACKEHQMKMMLRVRPKTTDITNLPVTNDNDNNKPPTDQQKLSTLSVPTTTAYTTSTTTTKEAPKQPTRKPANNNLTDKPNDGDTVPGSDGFPDDETVIHAGDGPSINSGVIGDSGMENSGISIYSQHRHYVHSLCVIASLSWLISAVLLLR